MNPFKEPKEPATVPVVAPEGTPEDSGRLADAFVVDRNSPHQQDAAAEFGWDTLERIAKTNLKTRKQMEQN